jgi:TPR repeat protein
MEFLRRGVIALLLACISAAHAQEPAAVAQDAVDATEQTSRAPVEFDFQPGKTDVAALWQDFLARADMDSVAKAYEAEASVYAVDGSVDAEACRQQQRALSRAARMAPVGVGIWHTLYLCAGALDDDAGEASALAGFEALASYAFAQFRDGNFESVIRVVHVDDVQAFVAASGQELLYMYFDRPQIGRTWNLYVSLWDAERERERNLRFDFIDTWMQLSRDDPVSRFPVLRMGLIQAFVEGTKDIPGSPAKATYDVEQAFQQADVTQRLRALEQLARSGDFGAATVFAASCLSAVGVNCAEQAVDAMLPFAERQYAHAMVWLARAYAAGRGVIRDQKFARVLIERADARLGDGLGSIAFAALSLMSGDEVELPDLIRRNLKGLSRDGNVLASAVIAGAEMKRNRGKKLSRQSRAALLAGAEAGYASMQFLYGGALFASGAHEDAMLWTRRAADQGFAPAQAVVGLAYESGQFAEKNAVESRRWYALAAHGGDANSTIKLAHYWHERMRQRAGPVPTPATSEQYVKLDPHWQSPADQAKKSAPPISNQAYVTADAEVVAQAEGWLHSAATIEYKPAIRALAELWSSRRDDLRGTPEDAIDLYQALIDSGEDKDGSVHLSVANLLLEDERVEHDMKRAVDALLAAAQLGNVRAQTTLGFGVLHGELTGIAMQEGEKWLRKAVAAGDGWAMNVLADVLYAGKNVEADLEEALSLWQRAIDAGESIAANNLAWALCASWREDLQDTKRGLELIEALRKGKDTGSSIIDTHAVCAAANGDFPRAVALQEEAVKRRREQEKAEMGELEQRLAQFRAGKRYVEPRPD